MTVTFYSICLTIKHVLVQVVLFLVSSHRTLWQYLKTVPMGRISQPATNWPMPQTLVLSILPVLWTVQTAVMEHATMSYRTTLQTADVSLQCLNSAVKMWLCLWLPEI